MTKKMTKMDSNSTETLLIANFEEVLNNTITFSYGKDHIEFPGVVILRRENSSNLITRLLNPGIEIVDIVENVFEEMQTILESAILDKSRIVTDSKIRPIRKNVINLVKLQESAIFVKSTEDSLLVNNYIFTNNEAEFHGDGMFTSKLVFFVGYEDISKIRNLFEEESKDK